MATPVERGGEAEPDAPENQPAERQEPRFQPDARPPRQERVPQEHPPAPARREP